jgi:hypothetical protein
MGGSLILSEIGTCQLEFRALAHYTGRAEYVKAVSDGAFAPLYRTTARLQVDFITDHLRTVNHTDGLFPVTFSKENGLPWDSEC